MKFTEKKKAKMRRTKFKRNKREWKNSKGHTIDQSTRIVDTMCKASEVYFLCYNYDTKEYSIYKAIAPSETIKLLPKKIIENSCMFEKTKNWRNKSIVTIDKEKGSISYKKGKECMPNKIFVLAEY